MLLLLKAIVFFFLVWVLVVFAKVLWRPTRRWEQIDAQQMTPYLTGGSADLKWPFF